MAVQTNGQAKQPNGYAKSSITSPSTRPSKGFFARIPSIFVRICIWYTAFTLLVRCPSSPSELTAESPAVCEPYFQLRAAVLPHLQPYYNQYLEPYAEKAQPYFEKAKANVYVPAVAFAQTHGGPRLTQAQAYGQKEWQRTVRPQLDSVQEQLYKQYDATLGPHVQKHVAPYYNSAKTSAVDLYELEVLPAYRHTAPHARKLYSHASRFTTTTLLPYASWTTDLTWTFVKRQVWPRVQILYGENVEPQILKISQRLGRYRDEKKVEAAADAVESSISSSSTVVPTAAASVASSISSSVESIVTKASSVVAATPSMAKPDEDPNPAQQFSQDMELWEDQVAKAVHEGADHLRDRVQDICDRLIDSQAKTVGDALIIQLEEGSASAFKSLKAKVETIIHALPDDASEDQVTSAENDILAEVRKAGQVVKQKAQNVREWKQKYDSDTTNLVEAAANSTLETVDNIRDLRLQDIGRRWASNSAITHKDWAKYNELKKASNEWRNDVEVVALQHTRLTDARKAATDVEERAMAAAEEAAKELTRLKEASQWKLASRDHSSDFDTKYIPPIAAKAKQGVLGAVSDAKEAVMGSSQGSVESATSVASSKASDIASSASEAVWGSETGSVESAASKASAKVLGTQQSSYESVASVVSESVHSVASAASETVIGTEPGVGEKAATKISEAVVGRETPTIESISSAASSRIADATVAAGSLGPKAASLLNAAQARASSSGSSINSAASNAGSVASSASSVAASSASSVASSSSSLASSASSVAASSASSVASSPSSVASSASSVAASSASSVASSPSSVASSASSVLSSSASVVASQLSKSVSAPSSIASDASESIVSASAKASNKVWGGAMAQAAPSARSIVFDEDIVDDDSYSQRVQDIISKAGDKASELTQIIQDAVNPTSTQGSVESITSLASAQYESALSAASSVLLGTEQGTGESISSVASEKYAEAVTAASYAIYGSPSPASFLSSISASGSSVSSGLAQQASSRYDAAVSQASSQYSAAKSQVSVQISGTPKPVHEEMISSVEAAYSDSVSAASDKLQGVLSYTSALSIPTLDTNILSSVSAIASSRLSEGLSAASEQYNSAKVAVGATPAPVQQRYLADAQRKYYEAIGYAHDRYAAFESAGRDMISQASTAVQPSQTPAYESMLSAASSRYSVAVAAASENLQNLASSASSVVGVESQGPLESASSQYNAAISAASASLASVSSQASEAIYGSSTPVYENLYSEAHNQYSSLSTAISGTQPAWTDTMATQASANWEALVSRASEQVYGSPTPWSESIASQAGEYASQATDAAVDQYGAVAALFSELVIGREPDFTESVMQRLESAYYTGAPAIVSSASSYASDVYASASSVASSVFTPPATVEVILDNAQQQINAAVEAASIQFYGTTKGTYEQATEAAASAYADASAKASEAVYGTQTGYAEAAQSQMTDAAASAQQAISLALFGTPTGTIESATSVAAGSYTSISSVAAENLGSASSKVAEGYEAVTSAISSALYGPEQGALESAQSRISVAIESAKSRMSEFSESASRAADDSVSKVRDNVQDAASSISSAATSIGSAVSDGVQDAASSVSSAATSIGSAVSDGVQDAASSVSSVATSITSVVRDEL